MTTAWDKGIESALWAGELLAALDPGWRPEDPHDLTEKFCILRSVVANSGVINFPAQPCDCFCEVDPQESDWHDRGDAFRFIAEAVRTALQGPASRRCHPTEARGKVLVMGVMPVVGTAGPITRVMLGDGGWRVFTAAGSWWDAEGDADDPESQWVNVVDD